MDEWHSIPGFADPMSSLSHLVGTVLFFNAGVLLLWRTRLSPENRARNFWFCLQFVVASLFCLSMSFVYHMVPLGGTARAVMLRLDVAAIFVLIASTFTVIHGIAFRGWRCWAIVGLLWGIAAVGIPLRMVFFDSVSHVAGNGIFLLMGWVGVLSAWLVWRAYGWRYLGPVVLGGICYTIGAVVNAANWPVIIDRVWGPHETFHLFVLAGLAVHWGLAWKISNN